jgi:hypothetical protein
MHFCLTYYICWVVGVTRFAAYMPYRLHGGHGRSSSDDGLRCCSQWVVGTSWSLMDASSGPCSWHFLVILNGWIQVVGQGGGVPMVDGAAD